MIKCSISATAAGGKCRNQWCMRFNTVNSDYAAQISDIVHRYHKVCGCNRPLNPSRAVPLGSSGISWPTNLVEHLFFQPSETGFLDNIQTLSVNLLCLLENLCSWTTLFHPDQGLSLTAPSITALFPTKVRDIMPATSRFLHYYRFLVFFQFFFGIVFVVLIEAPRYVSPPLWPIHCRFYLHFTVFSLNYYFMTVKELASNSISSSIF